MKNHPFHASAGLAGLMLSLTFGTASHGGTVMNQSLSGSFSTPVLMGVSGFVISPDSATVAYRANPNSPTRQEHFLVPLAGGTALSANLYNPGSADGELRTTAGLGVFSMDSSSFHSLGTVESESGYAETVHVATRGTAGAVNRLMAIADSFSDARQLPYANGVAYLETYKAEVTVRRTTATDTKQLISPDALVVTDWKFTPDGTRLITSGTGGSVSGEAVYSTHQTTLASTALTPAPVTGGGIDSFQVSPNSTMVVIKGTITGTTHAELHSRPADGSGSLTSLVGAPFSAGDYAITPDSSKVVYLRSGGGGGTELFVKPITGGAPVKLNGTLPTPASAVRSFQITADSQRVIYLADQSTAGKVELYSSAIDGSGNVKLNDALTPPSGRVTTFQLSPDGSFVVYRADAAAALRFELFHVPVTGGTAARQHPPLTLSRSIAADFGIPSRNHIIFRGDVDGPAGQVRLYAAHAGTAVVTRLDNNTLLDGDVKSWQVSPDGGKIAYLADQTHDESQELFAAWGVPSTPSNWPDRSGPVGGFLPALNYVISDAETPSALLTISAKSSNQALIPDTGLVFTGTGDLRTLNITPTAGATGRSVITVSISDGVHTTDKTFTITRYSNEYWSWLTTHFGTVVITNESLKSSVWGPSADADKDGQTNLYEYALNGNPRDGLPVNALTLEMRDDAGTPRAYVSHPVRHSEPNLTYTLGVSSALDAWATGSSVVNPTEAGRTALSTGVDLVTWPLAQSATAAPRQYVRLTVGWTIGE